MAPAQEASHDQKPFKAISVKARRGHREHPARIAVAQPVRAARPVVHEQSPLPPSRAGNDDQQAAKPDKHQRHQGRDKPVRTEKPARPDRAEKPKNTTPKPAKPDNGEGNNHGSGHKGKPEDPATPPPASSGSPDETDGAAASDSSEPGGKRKR